MIVITIIQILEGHLAYKVCTNSKNPNIKLLNVKVIGKVQEKREVIVIGEFNKEKTDVS